MILEVKMNLAPASPHAGFGRTHGDVFEEPRLTYAEFNSKRHRLANTF